MELLKRMKIFRHNLPLFYNMNYPELSTIKFGLFYAPQERFMLILNKTRNLHFNFNGRKTTF